MLADEVDYVVPHGQDNVRDADSTGRVSGLGGKK
jgi:hypothetical protein